MIEATTGNKPEVSPAPSPERYDPFAADALASADTQMARFLALLALIDRTVLPRCITIETGTAIFSLDIADRLLALLPRRQNIYAVDQQLADNAPKAHRLLSKRAQAVQKASDRLSPHRDAILRCAGRLLWGLAGTGRAHARISAVPREEIARHISFTALEIYRAAAFQASGGKAGAATRYFEAMSPRALSAWRATRTGWALDYANTGDTQDTLRALARISAAARDASTWLMRTGVIGTPSLGFLSGPGHRTIRCVAADDSHIVHLTLPTTAWSGALQSWDAVSAGPGTSGADALTQL